MKQKAQKGARILLDHLSCTDLMEVATSIGVDKAEDETIHYLKSVIINESESLSELLSHKEITSDVLTSYIDREKNIPPVSKVSTVWQELVDIVCKHLGEPPRAESTGGKAEAATANPDLPDSSRRDSNLSTPVASPANTALPSDDGPFSQFLKLEPGEKATFKAQLKEIGQKVSNIGNCEFYPMTVGRGRSLLGLRNYKLSTASSLANGKSYEFQNVIRKNGSQHFWVVSESNIEECRMIKIEYDADFEHNKIPVVPLEVALQKTMATVEGKVIQVTPSKRRQGSRAISVIDKQDATPVKLLIWDRPDPIQEGDIVRATNTYPKNDKTTLSIAREGTLEVVLCEKLAQLTTTERNPDRDFD